MWESIGFMVIALSLLQKAYKFERSLELDDPNRIGSYKYKENSHDIEIDRAPVIFEYHVRVASHEDNKVHLLGLVWDTDDIFGCQDF